MAFKHSRLSEIWVNGQDISVFDVSHDFNAKVDAAETTTFKAAWKTYITGLAMSQLSISGYYDPTQTTVRSTLQAASGVATFFPSGATAIGDQGRLLGIVATDYAESSPIANPVAFNWAATSTSTVGYGVCLHVLQSESLGTITGTGDGVLTSLQSTTGAVATLHVTAVSSSTSSSFKLQDATTQGGAYTDIAGGAFTNVTATGAQRLVIPGTIRAFVRAVAVIGPATTTYGIAVART